MMLKSTTMPMKQSPLLPQDWNPKGYMKKAIKFGLTQSCAGFFLDPGLGKTSISLAIIKILIKEGLIDCALIIAPLRVCYSVWPREMAKWKDFNGLTYQILHGDKKEKALDTEANIYIINPEGLSWLLTHSKFKEKFKGQALFIDESSKFKDTQTQRFKLLRPFLSLFRRRYILTGSPAPNGLLDLFGQIFVLDLGAALGQYISHYRAKYFFKSGFQGYDWKLQPGADKLIQDRIRPLTLRLDAEDHLTMPKLIVNPIYVDLDPKSWGMYKEMEDELIVALDRGDVTAVSAAVASGKCSQIANGGIYDEDGKAHFIHDLKAKAVDELVGELNGTPALVAYEYGHDLERLQSVVGKNTPHIGGGVSPKRATTIENDWNAGDLPVLLGQPASVAHGLNLQNAGNHVIWHSLIWNFEHYDQFNRRIRRQGQQHDTVYVHHIIARNTIDELKLAAMNNKFRTQKDLFDALNNFLKRKNNSDSEYSLLSSPEGGKVNATGQVTSLNPLTGGTKMSKFAKKDKAAEAPAKAAKKPKLWTNDAAWQDQETGVNTPDGDLHQKSLAKAAGKKAVVVGKSKPAANADKESSRSAEAFRQQKITLLVKENPKREGSASHARYELYRKAKTVGAFIEAGGKAADVTYDAAHEFISVG